MSAAKRRELRQVMRLVKMCSQANGPYRDGWPRRVHETAPLIMAARALFEAMQRRHPGRAEWVAYVVEAEQSYRSRGVK